MKDFMFFEVHLYTFKTHDFQEKLDPQFNSITSCIFYSWEIWVGGIPPPPPSLIFLKCLFLWFWWNHLQTVYDCRSHAKGDSQKFEIEDFIAIWKKSSFFWKNPVVTEKFISQSNLNRFYSSFLQTSSFC